MKRGEEAKPKKIVVTVRIGGRREPVQKEALVCPKSGKVIRFVDNSR